MNKIQILEIKNKWKLLRTENNVSNENVDLIFDLFLNNNIFDENSVAKLNELQNEEQHLEHIEVFGKDLLHSNKSVINYEVDLDCWIHPIDFESYFKNEIIPVLDINVRNELSFNFKTEIINDDCIKYLIEFETLNNKYSLEFFQDGEYLESIYLSLNKILCDLETKKRFVDIDQVSKGYFEPNKIYDICKLINSDIRP